MGQISLATGSLGRSPVLESLLKNSLGMISPRDLFDYSDSSGLPELRSALADLHGNIVPKESILITSSSQQALSIVFETFLKAKDSIYLQSPTFFGMLRISKGSRVMPFENSLPSLEGMGPESAIYVTSNFQNPSGESLDGGGKESLARIAKEKGVMVVEDNPCDFLYFGEKKPESILSLSKTNVIYISTLSKMLAPGLRLGYIVAEEEKIAKLRSRKITQDLFTSTLCQRVALNCLKTDYLEKLREEFKKKRDLILSLLDFYFQGDESVSWSSPEGGIFIQFKLDTRFSIDMIIKCAEEKYGLILEGDHHIYWDGKSRNTIRLNFVKNETEVLEDGIEMLSIVVKEVQGGKTT